MKKQTVRTPVKLVVNSQTVESTDEHMKNEKWKKLLERNFASTPYINGIPPKERPPVNLIPPIRQPNMSEKYNNIDDICCVALICEQHQRLALMEEQRGKGLFLPNVSFQFQSNALCEILKNLIKKVIGSPRGLAFTKFQMSTDRIQIPKTGTFVQRIIYRIKVCQQKYTKKRHHQHSRTRSRISFISYSNSRYSKGRRTPKTRQPCICQRSPKAKWRSQSEIVQQTLTLWGPEPKQIIRLLEDNEKSKKLDKIQAETSDSWFERILLDLWMEFSLSQTFYWEVMKCCPFFQEEIISIYNEFVFQCLPSQFMGYPSFKFFLEKIGILDYRETKIIQYFNSFDCSKMSYLRFCDLLLGLIIFRRKFNSCTHEKCRLKRYEYIFRYFSSNSTSLNLNDLCRIVMEYLRNQKQIPGNDGYEQKLFQEIKRRISTKIPNGKEFSFNEFYSLSLKDKFFPFLGIQTNMSEFFDLKLYWNFIDIEIFKLPMLKWRINGGGSLLKLTQKIVLSRLYDHRCESCRQKRFYISSHFLTLSDNGEIIDIRRLIVENKNQPQNVSDQLQSEISENHVQIVANDILIKLNKFVVCTFGSEKLPKSEEKILPNWFYSTKEELRKCCKLILENVEKIFEQEPRILSITSPCYIFGDIHGNIKDLIHFSHIIWKSSPFINQSKYLFLGDYVDRGQYGIECIMYLFCLKILAPEHFFLLRGNHEIREIQEQFSFCDECVTRFNKNFWESVNLTFDVLPIGAVVDNKIFCAHGGIPYSVNTIDQLRNIKRLEEMADTDPAWQLLWNDPVERADFQNVDTFKRATRFDMGNGFAQNLKRGTAYQFNESATLNFLIKNNLDFIIRAHEVIDDGFHFHHKGRVITVFSSSKYSEMNNLAASILLNQNRIRIIQFKEVS